MTQDDRTRPRLLEEPLWLRERRVAALESARDPSLPDRAGHRFRFTDPARLWPGEPGTSGTAHVRVETSVPGVMAGAFPAVLGDAGDTIAEFLGRLALPDDPFLAWNLASFASGAVVVIPAGARVEDPIRIRVRVARNGAVVGDGRAGQIDRPVAAVRNLIVLGRGAQARVHEFVISEDGLLNGVTEVVIADEARLEHARMLQAGSGAKAFWHTRTSMGREASLWRVQALSPVGLWKDEAVTILDGPGARSEESALINTDGEAHADLRVIEDHATRDAQSRVTVRAVASGRGRVVFTGLLRVREGASGSEAYEEARCLLRSPEASADLLPELEILNHDVRASHGAAVGPLDEEARHYLMSRGIPAGEAEAMLVRGFVAPVLDAFPSEMKAGWPWADPDEDEQ